MKALSIAVLALLGNVSAVAIRNAVNQEQALEETTMEDARPDDTILLQTDSNRRFAPRHSLSQHKHHAAARLRANLGVRGRDPDVPYAYPAKGGEVEWYELDNADERIHGSNRFEEMDDQSPHDPDVVDAPEDMKRVGNDHEELHNAKLSPDGYHNGFYHKDFEGNYAQKRSHHHHHKHHKENEMIQIQDHENDTDDLPASYEADGAHAIPKDGQSDYDLVQTHAVINTQTHDNFKDWSQYMQSAGQTVLDDQKKDNDNMEQVYAQEEDESSYEFVQLNSDNKYDHENDSEDIPDGQDPLDYHKKGTRRMEPMFDKAQYLAEQKENKLQKDIAEVNSYMQEQTDEDRETFEQMTKRDHDKELVEMQAARTKEEQEQQDDVNTQIKNYAGRIQTYN